MGLKDSREMSQMREVEDDTGHIIIIIIIITYWNPIGIAVLV